MTFGFRQVTISGHRADTEATSEVINEITDVLVNEMGWGLEDDRRSQAGSSNVTLTHKVVFKSNGGESGDQPDWYFTLTSGTGAAVGSNFVGSQLHTAYDIGTHDTAASGVETPTGHTTITLGTDSDGPFTLWISGDKDGVIFLTKPGGIEKWLTVGRSQHFLDNTLEPFGLYINHSTTNFNAVSSIVDSIAGSPPTAFTVGEFLSYSLIATNDPRIGLGGDEALWTAMPLLHTVDVNASNKGAIGICSNFWAMTQESTGIDTPTEFLASGTSNRYLAFGSTGLSLLIRKS